MSSEWVSEESEINSSDEENKEVIKNSNFPYNNQQDVSKGKQKEGEKKDQINRAEKYKQVDKMVGLLKIEENKNEILIVDDTMSKWEVAFTLLISFVFIFSFVFTVDIYAGFEVREAVTDIFEQTTFNEMNQKFENINKIDQLDQFLRNVVIQQVKIPMKINIDL